MTAQEEKNKKYILAIFKKLAQKKSDIEIVGIKKAEGLIKKRIFNQGKDANDRRIGSYSTASGYYGKKSFIKAAAFKPTGKNSKKTKKGNRRSQPTFKNGKERKTMYLDKGYSELRRRNGRQVSFVDFEYTGDLFSSIQLNAKSSHAELGIYSRKETDKANGLESRFNKKVFSPTENEKSLTLQAMQNEVRKYISQMKLQ